MLLFFHTSVSLSNEEMGGPRPGKSNDFVSQSLIKHTSLAQDDGLPMAATRKSGHTIRSKVFASKQRLFIACNIVVVFVD